MFSLSTENSAGKHGGREGDREGEREGERERENERESHFGSSRERFKVPPPLARHQTRATRADTTCREDAGSRGHSLPA